MLLLPNFQRTSGFFAARFFRSGCKGTSLYNFNQIFLLFFRSFFFRISTRWFEELSLFWSGLQSYNLYHFYQIFLPNFWRFFLLTLTRTFWRTIAFLQADGKDTRSIFITKFFFHFPFTSYSHFYSLIYSPSAKNLFDLLLSLSSFLPSSSPLFRGVCFKSGCKDKQLHIPAKYFYIFFFSFFWNAVPVRVP